MLAEGTGDGVSVCAERAGVGGAFVGTIVFAAAGTVLVGCNDTSARPVVGLGAGVEVAVGKAVAVDEATAASVAVTVAVAVGTTVQTGSGVGFHNGPGVGVAPLGRAGTSTVGTRPV